MNNRHSKLEPRFLICFRGNYKQSPSPLPRPWTPRLEPVQTILAAGSYFFYLSYEHMRKTCRYLCSADVRDAEALGTDTKTIGSLASMRRESSGQNGSRVWGPAIVWLADLWGGTHALTAIPRIQKSPCTRYPFRNIFYAGNNRQNILAGSFCSYH